MSQTANLAALQIFLTNRLFIKAGFGLAEVVQYDRRVRTGAAPRWRGIGLEVIQGWHWSLDIEATVTGARYKYSTRHRDLDQLVARQFRDQFLLGP